MESETQESPQAPVQTQDTPKKSNRAAKVIAIIGAVVVCLFVLGGLALGLIVKSMMPKAITKKEISQVSEMVLDYLNNKYGDQGFRIKHLDTSNSYNGFVYSGREGYDVALSANNIEYFRVLTRGAKASTTRVSYDGFIEEYYDTQEPDAFEKSLGMTSYTFGVNATVVPDNLGHIPTIGELWNYGAIKSYEVTMYEKNCNDGEVAVEPTECIKDTTEQLATHYGITKDFSYYLTFYLNDNSRFDAAVVEVKGQQIYLKKGDTILYTLNR